MLIYFLTLLKFYFKEIVVGQPNSSYRHMRKIIEIVQKSGISQVKDIFLTFIKENQPGIHAFIMGNLMIYANI